MHQGAIAQISDEFVQHHLSKAPKLESDHQVDLGTEPEAETVTVRIIFPGTEAGTRTIPFCWKENDAVSAFAEARCSQCQCTVSAFAEARFSQCQCV